MLFVDLNHKKCGKISKWEIVEFCITALHSSYFRKVRELIESNSLIGEIKYAYARSLQVNNSLTQAAYTCIYPALSPRPPVGILDFRIPLLSLDSEAGGKRWEISSGINSAAE